MWISTNWLKRHVDLDGVDLAELTQQFILSVAEIEETKTVGEHLNGVVIGKVLEVGPIEGARVQRTVVDLGHLGKTQIVCGAPNVAEGQLVFVATVGADLGPASEDGKPFVIAEREVRGVLSAGMICGEDELGLGSDGSGIMVLDPDVDTPPGKTLTPGTPVTELWDLVDTLFEIDNKSLTHRPDCWGHRGIAREVAALLGRELKPMALDVPYTDARPLQLAVEDAVACPRYSAVCMTGIQVAPSPLWLRVLLHRVGTRAISNAVDATNFVMLDLGNPLHAFDAREVRGGRITVRRAAAGETFTTLDDQERALTATDLVIADGERAVALAGIMGGLNSEIRDDTTDVVLEAATFDASVVRTTSQRLHLRTESSARFEKALDAPLAELASRAFCVLMAELSPGMQVTSAFMDVAAPAPEPTVITLRLQRLSDRLGVTLPVERVVQILERLEFGVERDGDSALKVTVPSFRATKDVGIEADLIEEVGRTFGYDNIPPEGAAVVISAPDPNARKRFERTARAHMSGVLGFDELMTYSFGFDPLLDKIGAKPTQRVALKHPISAEMPALRRSVVPGLLGVLKKNARREADVRVYELGRVFHPHPEPGPGNLPEQPTMLTALVGSKAEDAGLFFQLKGALVGLARAVERAMPSVAQGWVADVWAHPVRQASLTVEGTTVGCIAEIHPLTRKQLGLQSHEAAALVLDLDAWRDTAKVPVGYQPLAKYPSVFRDYAVVVDEAVRAGQIADAIRAAAPDRVQDVAFQSVYRDDALGDGRKSMAWSVTLGNPQATLAEAEIRDLEAAIWANISAQTGGVPRA